jgi:hypothetical protein
MTRAAHAASDRYDALDSLVRDVSVAEEAYADLPFEYRIPLVKKLLLSYCTRLVDEAFVKARARLGSGSSHIPRFTTEIDLGPATFEDDPNDWKLPNEEKLRRATDKVLKEIEKAEIIRSRSDRVRAAAEAEATAIVYSATEDCPGAAQLGNWKQKVTEALHIVGLAERADVIRDWRRKKYKPHDAEKAVGMTESGFAAWRKACKDPASIIYATERRTLKAQRLNVGSDEEHLAFLEEKPRALVTKIHPFTRVATGALKAFDLDRDEALVRFLSLVLGLAPVQAEFGKDKTESQDRP